MSHALFANLRVSVAFLAQGDRAGEKRTFFFLPIVVKALATLITVVDARNRTVFAEVFLANGVLASVKHSIESIAFDAGVTAFRPREATIVTVIDGHT